MLAFLVKMVLWTYACIFYLDGVSRHMFVLLIQMVFLDVYISCPDGVY